MNEQLYSIKYYNDEITIELGYCKNVALCSCYLVNPDNQPKCGYPLIEAKQKLVDYYLKRAEDIQSMSDSDFLRSQGIYV